MDFNSLQNIIRYPTTQTISFCHLESGGLFRRRVNETVPHIQ